MLLSLAKKQVIISFIIIIEKQKPTLLVRQDGIPGQNYGNNWYSMSMNLNLLTIPEMVMIVKGEKRISILMFVDKHMLNADF